MLGALLLKFPWLRTAAFIFAAFLVGAAISGFKVREHYVTKMAVQEAIYEQQVAAAAETAKAVDVIVVTKMKYKKQALDTRKKEILEKTERELKNEDQSCVLGPNFVRLHNDAARSIPDAERGSDEPPTKRAERVSP